MSQRTRKQQYESVLIFREFWVCSAHNAKHVAAFVQRRTQTLLVRGAYCRCYCWIVSFEAFVRMSEMEQDFCLFPLHLISFKHFRKTVGLSMLLIYHIWWVSTQGENGGSLIFSKNEGSFLIFQIGFLDTRNEGSLWRFIMYHH